MQNRLDREGAILECDLHNARQETDQIIHDILFERALNKVIVLAALNGIPLDKRF